MSRDEYVRMAEASLARAAEYTEWALRATTRTETDRYRHYAETSIADADWYLERAERLAIADEERIAA